VTDLAPVLQGFFTDRLARQKKASPNTVAAYRDCCRLLLAFAQAKTGKAPSQFSLADLDATLIGEFLHHLEEQRGNGSATRNARLAAIHSLFKYAAPKAPEHAAVISQVLAIPPRRRERAIVSYLTAEEIDALVAAPGRETWHGRRDRALLLLDVQTGLRVSELTGLKRQDIHLGTGPHVRCHGKGRKDRATPLTTQTVKVMRTWLAELSPDPAGPLFPTQPGGPLSRDAVERLVARHAATAAAACPSIKEKHVTPHTLRHSAAMTLLKNGVDTSVIALWLGHEGSETTQIYLHADMTIKEHALARVQQPGTTPGRYRRTPCSRSSAASSHRHHPPGYAAPQATAPPARQALRQPGRHNPDLGISGRLAAGIHWHATGSRGYQGQGREVPAVSSQAGTFRAQDLDHSRADGSGPLPRLRNRGPPR
jgi:site-specific recombinase XerD